MNGERTGHPGQAEPVVSVPPRGRPAAVAARPAGQDETCRWGRQCESLSGLCVIDCPAVAATLPDMPGDTSSPVTDQARDEIIEALIGQPVVRDYYTLPITPRDAHLLADAVLATPTLRRLLDTTASPAIRPIRPETGPSGIGGRSRDDLRASGGAEGDSGTSSEEGL